MWSPGRHEASGETGINKIVMSVFLFYKGITMISDKKMLVRVRCRGHGEPWSFLPGIAEEGP
jgi:hypothetical protein